VQTLLRALPPVVTVSLYWSDKVRQLGLRHPQQRRRYHRPL